MRNEGPRTIVTEGGERTGDKTLEQQVRGEAWKRFLKRIREQADYFSADELLLMQKEFDFTSEIEEDPEAQSAIKKLLLNILNSGSGNAVPKAVQVVKEFHISRTILNSDEIRNACSKCMEFSISYSHMDSIVMLQETFGGFESAFTSEKVENRLKTKLVKCLSGSPAYVNYALRLVKLYSKHLPSVALLTIIHSSEIQSSARKSIARMFLDIILDRLKNTPTRASMAMLREIAECFDITVEESIDELYEDALRKRDAATLCALAVHFPNVYAAKNQEVIATSKVRAFDGSLSISEREHALDLLAGFEQHQGIGAVAEFSALLRQNSDGTQVDARGLSAAQEAALLLLLRLDNAASNNALFAFLLDKNPHAHVRLQILRELSKDDRNFLTEQLRKALRRFCAPESPRDWNDLNFLEAMQAVRSSELRGLLLERSAPKILSTSRRDQSWTNLRAQIAPNVPMAAFERVCYLADRTENSGVIIWFNTLYADAKGESNQANLLYAITHACEVENQVLLERFMSLLVGMNPQAKEAVAECTAAMRKVTFIDSIPRLVNARGYDHNGDEHADHDEDSADNQVSQQASISFGQIFEGKVSSWNEMNRRLSDAVSIAFKKVLPHPDITANKIEAVTTRWGDLEPIFTYMRRYPQLRSYVAEMVVHFDNTESWKGWRYDIKNPKVRDQIGWLTETQRGAWIRDYIAEVGDFEVKAGETSKPAQIRQLLLDAIAGDRHLANEQAAGAQFPWSQDILGRAFGKIMANPDQARELVDAEMRSVEKYESAIDSVVLANGAQKIDQLLSGLLVPGDVVPVNSRSKNALKTLKPYLTDDAYLSLIKKIKFSGGSPVPSDVLLPAEMRTAVQERIHLAQSDAQKSEDLLRDIGLSLSSPLPELYKRRAEAQAVKNLLRLTVLEPRNIALNLLAEGKKKGEGGTIVAALTDLKKVYKGSGFLQDIGNIEAVLTQSAEDTGKRQLALVVSDNPSLLWQSGKYPLGNGSCQHYAEGSTAQALMGYVGDAHTKVGYLFDVRALPEEFQSRMRGGVTLQAMLDDIPPLDLLRATIARSIIKILRAPNKTPAIFIEPVYSVVNKSNRGMDRYFELFTEFFIASEMDARVTRGGSELNLRVPASRNPSGQYEDGAYGGADHAGMGIQNGSYTLPARFVDGRRDTTAEAKEIYESMRWSSGH